MMAALDNAWTHDREHIRALHHAHADHIESLYTAMARLPGNPQGVIVASVGGVRTLLARGNRWENRAIFHGDETREQIDQVLDHFEKHCAGCVIEVNVANSYVNPPQDWEARLLPHLLARGCTPGGMRCVWYCESPETPLPTDDREIQIVRFVPDRMGDYAELAARVSPNDPWTPERLEIESRPGLVHYIGLNRQQEACALGSMFTKDTTAYLAYWETRLQCRGKGFQLAGIRRRVADAFQFGCQLVFAVSDYNFSSARNLERCGFKLAYNYLVVQRKFP